MPKRSKNDTGAATSGVAAVERALTILGVFGATDESLSLAQLAERTGLYKSTILRLIASLESFGYMRRIETGEYQVGPKLFELGQHYLHSFKLDHHVIPVLKAIATETSESASFYVRDGDKRMVLFRCDSEQAVRDNVRAGDRLPLNKGAGGKILLRFEEGLAAARRSLAPDFVISTFGERQPDTAAVAAPVFGAGGRLVGAIGVSGPKTRFTIADVTRMSRAIFDAGAKLSRDLGAPDSIYPKWAGQHA